MATEHGSIAPPATAPSLRQPLRALQPYLGSYLSASAPTAVLAGVPEDIAGTHTVILARDWSMPANGIFRYDGADSVVCRVDVDISCSTNVPNGEVHFYLYRSVGGGAFAAVTGIDIDREISTANDHGAMSMGGLVEMSANDRLQVWVAYEKNANVTADHCALSVTTVGTP